MSKRDIQPHWRPNFKIQSTLPDIKVVRTNFMINFITVAVALVALFMLLQQEYRAHALRDSIAVLQDRIQASDADDQLNLKRSEAFHKSAQSVVELQRFYRAPFVAHRLLADLAVLKPEGLTLSRITFSESIQKPKKGASKMAYTIRLFGTVEDLPVLSAFKETLQSAPAFEVEGFVAVVDENIQRRNLETGVTPFQISIVLNPGAPAKGDKK